jgi:5-formyltetrahydrofolate cyclo-ligase
MTHTKGEWRRRLLTARRQLDDATRRAASARIAVRVQALGAFTESPTVLTYRALGAEVDPSAIAEAAAIAGKTVYYVTVDEDGVRWIVAGEGSEERTEASPYAAPLPSADPLCVIVPGVGFDARGFRLGRGGGLYDRALVALRAAHTIHAVGLAYEMQVVPELPVAAWDQPVDLVVTEDRVLPTKPESGATIARSDREEGTDRCR